MKHLKHPATIIATLALFVGLAGGAYASGLINGAKIKNGSISAKKLNKAAVKAFTAPAGTMATYTATASSSPTPTPLGTFLGDTLAAECAVDGSGNVALSMLIKTSDGSWNIQYAYDQPAGTVYPNTIVVPAGTIASPIGIDEADAAAGGASQDTHVTFLQSAPQSGQLAWHLRAVSTGGSFTSNTCQATVQAIPLTSTAHNAAGHATATKPGSLFLRPGKTLLGRN
jgi:hypothetical protein